MWWLLTKLYMLSQTALGVLQLASCSVQGNCMQECLVALHQQIKASLACLELQQPFLSSSIKLMQQLSAAASGRVSPLSIHQLYTLAVDSPEGRFQHQVTAVAVQTKWTSCPCTLGV